MKCTLPQITWNNRDPIFSLDIQPKTDNFIRLATGGSDPLVVIWYINIDENGSVSVEPAAELSKHQKSVNIVRWSPSGEILASGDDESNIILWKRRSDFETQIIETGDAANFICKEVWLLFKVLRGHSDDVHDLCWSPDSNELLSGSVDNSAIIWNINKTSRHMLNGNHKGFVQGVAWDPLNQYLATLSSDRVCRVFDLNTKKVVSRSSKGTLPVPESSPLHNKIVPLYHDDTMKSYFRRLSFSPDGKLLIAPSGCVETEECRKKIHTAYIYTRFSFKKPALALPSPDNFTVAVKCCPVLFQLRKNGPKPLIPLPYRIVIALATQTSVVFYDTQQVHPFAVVSNIHVTMITDITWSSDGRVLGVSSTDGYCSFVTFKPNELGEIYEDYTPICTENLQKSKSESTNTVKPPIKIILEDEGIACDSWETNDKKIETEPCDENTADFQLVLEDTESQAKISGEIKMDVDDPEKKSKDEKESECQSKKKSEDENVTKVLLENSEKNLDNKVVESEEMAKSENVERNQGCPKDSVPETESMPKTPRRIALITLSSPKSNKKRQQN